MIRPIFSTTSYNFFKTTPQKANQGHSQVAFSGIMDNPASKRVTDANGDTYIVEPGGQLVIKKETKENNATKGAIVGAGAGVTGGTVIAKRSNSENLSSQKTDDTAELKNHEIKDEKALQTEINEDNQAEIGQNSQINDDTADISETEYDDFDNDSIFDDNSEIYEF